MECEQARKLMNAFVDKEIDDEALNKLNEHLDSCESCTVEFEELKYMVQLMGEIDLKELPLGFENELHEKLIIASKEMASEKLADKQYVSKAHLFGGLIDRLGQFKMKRSYYALAAIPAIMVIVIIATKGFFLGQSKEEQAVAMDSYEMVQETTAGAMYGDNSEGSRAGIEIAPSSPEFKGTTEQENAFAKGSSPSATTEPSLLNADTDDYRDGRLIIQTANIRMDVEKYDEVMTTLKTMVMDSGGYIENESTSYKNYYSETDNLKYGYITIRMPSEAYNITLEQIKALGLVTMNSSNASDITKAYRDTAAEIENLKVTEARLREIMNQAVEIADILTIENELTRVRGSISSYEKQIKNWESLVDMTTISIELNEVKSLKPKVEPIDDSLFGKAKEGLINTINQIRRTVENFVIWLISNSPILVLLAIAAYIISFIYKKRIKGGTKNEK
jgi:hypothetical protein